jgi:hypothetical protein
MTTLSRTASLAPEALARRTLERRAVEAVIWGMPIVSFDAMRQAFFRDAGARYGDICYCSKPADWRLQLTSPNNSSYYVYLNLNTSDGPVVLDVPPAEGAGLFGSVNDAWQRPLADIGPAGEDQGKGGKYLLLPPAYDQPVPEGYVPVRCDTFNAYSALRAIAATMEGVDVAKAIGLVNRLRCYPLADASRPLESRYIDITGVLFDGIVRFDDRFFDRLAGMIDEEPVQRHDFAIMGQLVTLGIEKGQPFAPGAATRKLLKSAAEEAHALLIEKATHVTPFWPGKQWGLHGGVGKETHFSFVTDNRLAIDDRGTNFFVGCAPPVKLGAATFYLGTHKDSTGVLLDGSHTYHLHLPPNVPASQFWAVTVYDSETQAFIRQSPRQSIDSYDTNARKNPDGSLDVYFGPRVPRGKDANWLYTASGKPWWTFFRFYGPQEAVLDKTWQLPDIEKMW